MALRSVCLAANAWPKVIAEIIAEYAARTIEESIALLIGTQWGPPNECIVVSQSITAWWSSTEDGCVTFLFGFAGTASPPVHRDDIATSVRSRKWCILPPLKGRKASDARAMSPEEFRAINEWFASV